MGKLGYCGIRVNGKYEKRVPNARVISKVTLWYVFGSSYIKSDLSAWQKSVIWRIGLARVCSLCNLNEEECVIHFLGKYPILKDIRKKWLGNEQMDENECKNCMNRKDCSKLLGYLCDAMKLRKWLVDQFNF